jgi:hypothetical protein
MPRNVDLGYRGIAIGIATNETWPRTAYVENRGNGQCGRCSMNYAVCEDRKHAFDFVLKCAEALAVATNTTIRTKTINNGSKL